MADKPNPNAKSKQLSLQEYAKIKDKLAKARVGLNFPWIIKIFFLVPLLYFLFLLMYFLLHLRFLAEH